MNIQLKTSLTLCLLGEVKPLDYSVFQDEDRHFVISNKAISEGLKRFSLKEADIVKIPVGSPSHSEDVEFYAFDLKKQKDLLDQVGSLIHLAWIDAVHTSFRVTATSKIGFMDEGVTGTLDECTELVSLRRFVLKAFGPSARKKGMSKMLFHHETDNAKVD